MALIYRVTVDVVDTNEDIVDVLFTAATARADALARFAPAEVAAALGADAVSVTTEGPATIQRPDGTATALATETEAPKRKRRTKAEIAADEAAAAGVSATHPVTNTADTTYVPDDLPARKDAPTTTEPATEAAPVPYNPFA